MGTLAFQAPLAQTWPIIEPSVIQGEIREAFPHCTIIVKHVEHIETEISSHQPSFWRALIFWTHSSAFCADGLKPAIIKVQKKIKAVNILFFSILKRS